MKKQNRQVRPVGFLLFKVKMHKIHKMFTKKVSISVIL